MGKDSVEKYWKGEILLRCDVEGNDKYNGKIPRWIFKHPYTITND